MDRNEILSKYGKLLSKKDVSKIMEEWEDAVENNSVYIRSYTNSNGTPASDGIRAGEEVTPGLPPYHYYNRNLIPVYEVEWIETDKNFIE
jgi:hypothetical protein